MGSGPGEYALGVAQTRFWGYVMVCTGFILEGGYAGDIGSDRQSASG